MEAALRAINGVKETENALSPVADQTKIGILEETSLGEGNTLTNKKRDRGIIEAEANAVLAQMIPQGLAAYE